MNNLQRRLLLETEFAFYALGSRSVDGWAALLVQLGYKPRPDLSKLSDEALMRLNSKLRLALRSGANY